MQSKQQEQQKSKIKPVKLLVTGDENYNNIHKFNSIMDNICQSLGRDICIYTFGAKYGSQLLGRLYADQYDIISKTFSTDIFRNTKIQSEAKKYYMMLNVAIKQSDLILLFSNVYNKQIKTLIKQCEKQNKQYLLIKQ